MFLDDLNAFLLKQSGVTGKIVDLVMADNAKEPVFFAAYQSSADPLFRTLSIVTAPVCLTILAAEFAMVTIVIAFKSLYELITGEPKTAKLSASMICGCLLMMAVSLFALFASPAFNACDLIGGGINTLSEPCNEEEFSYGCL